VNNPKKIPAIITIKIKLNGIRPVRDNNFSFQDVFSPRRARCGFQRTMIMTVIEYITIPSIPGKKPAMNISPTDCWVKIA